MDCIKKYLMNIFFKIKYLFPVKNKKIIKVKPAEQQLEISFLFQEGYFFLCSAESLFPHPLHMFAGAVLSHHGIELILKACWIWDKGEYSFTHKLAFIVNQISFLKPTKNIQDLITKIDTYYHFRYPIENEVHSAIQRRLNRINDNEHGIPTLVGELSTYEWNYVNQLYNFIVDAMPANLRTLWEGTVQQYSQIS